MQALGAITEVASRQVAVSPSPRVNNRATATIVKVDKPKSFPYITKTGDGVKEPEHGWQVLRAPKHIIPQDILDKGNYLIEINPSHFGFRGDDLKAFDDALLVQRFKYELQHLAREPKVDHLIFSFNRLDGLGTIPDRKVTIAKVTNRHNWRNPFEQVHISGPSSIAQILLDTNLTMEKNGKMFSVIHNEPTLHERGLLNRRHMVHENLADAIIDSRTRPPSIHSTRISNTNGPHYYF